MTESGHIRFQKNQVHLRLQYFHFEMKNCKLTSKIPNNLLQARNVKNEILHELILLRDQKSAKKNIVETQTTLVIKWRNIFLSIIINSYAILGQREMIETFFQMVWKRRTEDSSISTDISASPILVFLVNNISACNCNFWYTFNFVDGLRKKNFNFEFFKLERPKIMRESWRCWK